jgi:hypothetical protein
MHGLALERHKRMLAVGVSGRGALALIRYPFGTMGMYYLFRFKINSSSFLNMTCIGKRAISLASA